MARELAGAPQPWVLNTLGPFPVDGSPALQADWLARIGDAAGYRQAAGITDPNKVVGPAPQSHPELLNWHTRVLGKLEIETQEGMIWAMTWGQLEATVAAGERMKATAPPEVSPELKAERLAEADARARGAELAALGDHQAAQEAQARADAAGVRATVLEGQAEVYARWEAGTSAERHEAEMARAELESRVKTAATSSRHADPEPASDGANWGRHSGAKRNRPNHRCIFGAAGQPSVLLAAAGLSRQPLDHADQAQPTALLAQRIVQRERRCQQPRQYLLRVARVAGHDGAADRGGKRASSSASAPSAGCGCQPLAGRAPNPDTSSDTATVAADLQSRRPGTMRSRVIRVRPDYA